MNNVSNIIDKFGGKTKMSQELGHRHPTTVQGWEQRNHIPQKHWQAILDAAKRLGITVSLNELAGIDIAA